MKIKLLAFLFLGAIMMSCQEDEEVIPTPTEKSSFDYRPLRAEQGG